jgi:hypothetical protein
MSHLQLQCYNFSVVGNGFVFCLANVLSLKNGLFLWADTYEKKEFN